MNKRAILTLALLSLMSLGTAAQAKNERILAFHTMTGVDGPFLGETNAIRGVVGDEDPWVVASAHGTLDSNGHLKIEVKGLIFAPGVPVKGGTNDETEFRAIVSCLTTAGTSVITMNVTTEGFPATIPSGDSHIDTTIDLPSPCVAPIIFVIAGSEDKWFTVTGFGSEAD